jgi:hypothetical protein
VSALTQDSVSWLLQLRVLGFGLLKDGDGGIGVFPQGEEVIVSGKSKDGGGIGIRASRSSRLQRIRTRHAQTRQGSGPAVPHDAAVGEIFSNSAAASVPAPPRDMLARECMWDTGKKDWTRKRFALTRWLGQRPADH